MVALACSVFKSMKYHAELITCTSTTCAPPGLLAFLKLDICWVLCYLRASAVALWLLLNPKLNRYLVAQENDSMDGFCSNWYERAVSRDWFCFRGLSVTAASKIIVYKYCWIYKSDILSLQQIHFLSWLPWRYSSSNLCNLIISMGFIEEFLASFHFTITE